MKRVFIAVIALLLASMMSAQVRTSISQSQKHQEQERVETTKRNGDIGLGVGTDYGGIYGIKGSFVPISIIGIFGSIGHYKVDKGWQLGMNLYFIPKTNKNNIRPYAKCSYGTNRMIYIEGTDEYDKVYTGWTPGFGVEIRFGARMIHGLNLALNVPIKSSEFKEDYETVEDDPNVRIDKEPLPIAFSIGYHFEF